MTKRDWSLQEVSILKVTWLLWCTTNSADGLRRQVTKEENKIPTEGYHSPRCKERYHQQETDQKLWSKRHFGQRVKSGQSPMCSELKDLRLCAASYVESG